MNPEVPELILELADGGVGRMYETTAGYTMEFADSCASPFLEKPCEQHYEPGTCSRTCDTCSCTFDPALYSPVDSAIEWQRVGSMLSISSR